MLRTIAGACLLSVALGGCGSSDKGPATLPHDPLVGKMKLWAVHQDVVPSSSPKVQCPGDIPIKAGSVFHCLVSGGGHTVRVTVTIENSKGYVTWTTAN